MPIASAPRSGTARRCWNSISITEVVAGGCRGRGAPRGRLAAVDRRAVLAGLPVVQASKFELVLRLISRPVVSAFKQTGHRSRHRRMTDFDPERSLAGPKSRTAAVSPRW